MGHVYNGRRYRDTLGMTGDEHSPEGARVVRRVLLQEEAVLMKTCCRRDILRHIRMLHANTKREKHPQPRSVSTTRGVTLRARRISEPRILRQKQR